MSWGNLAGNAIGYVLTIVVIGSCYATTLLTMQGIRKLWRKLRGIPVFYNWKRAKEFADKAASAVVKDLGMEGNSALRDSVDYRVASAIYDYAESYERKAF